MKEQEQEWREKRLVFGRLVAVTKKTQQQYIHIPLGSPCVEIEVKDWNEELHAYNWEPYTYGIAQNVDLEKLASRLGQDVELRIVDDKVVGYH